VTEQRPVRRAPRRRGFKRWSPIFGLALVIILAVGVPSYYTSRDSYCGSCHIMETYYETWEKSTHARIPCVDCHNESGAIGLVKGKSALFRQVVVNVIFRPDKVKGPGAMPNGNCIACHAEHRKITSGADLKLPAAHHKMKDNPFQCVDCHRLLVHDMTPNGKNVVRMKVCVDCHKTKKISVACETCHYNKEK